MALHDTVPGSFTPVSFTPLVSKQAAAPTAAAAGSQLAAGVASGAAAGATIGSIVPGIGTAIGAVAGAVIGAVPGIISMVSAGGGGTSQAQRLSAFSTGIQQALGRLPAVVALLQQASDQVTRFQTLSNQAGAPVASGMGGLTAVQSSGVNCGGGTHCHGSADLQAKITEVTPIAQQLQSAVAAAHGVPAAILSAAQSDLAFGWQALSVNVPPATPSGYPISDAAWQNLDAFEQAALSDIGVLQGLTMSVDQALAAATSANTALVSASQTLLADVNAFQAGVQTINPWTATAAGDADSRIGPETDAVKTALATATTANSALEAAMSGSGATS
jgi:hypothetical protein